MRIRKASKIVPWKGVFGQTARNSSCHRKEVVEYIHKQLGRACQPTESQTEGARAEICRKKKLFSNSSKWPETCPESIWRKPFLHPKWTRLGHSLRNGGRAVHKLLFQHRFSMMLPWRSGLRRWTWGLLASVTRVQIPRPAKIARRFLAFLWHFWHLGMPKMAFSGLLYP